MRRQAFHRELKIWIQVLEESDTHFTIKHPYWGTAVLSAKSMYDLTLRGPADFRRREQKQFKAQQAKEQAFTDRLHGYTERTLPDGTVIKVSLLTNDRLQRQNVVLIRHKQAWWLGSPKQQATAVVLAAEGDTCHELKHIERAMRRITGNENATF